MGILVSREFGEFAEFLSGFGPIDWARILSHLSDSAMDELRAGVGALIVEVHEDEIESEGDAAEGRIHDSEI